MQDLPPALTSALLDGVPHGFLGRRGGVSQGSYAGLNVGLGSDDDPAHVAENRQRAAAAVAPGRQLVTVRQVHGDTVVIAQTAWGDDARPQADAIVTRVPGLALGVLTADCAPVLLADPAAGVVGAAHAGWKGALAGVLDRTVDAMRRLGATEIVAAIGPCIARRSYEVDAAFVARFLAQDPETERFFAAGVRDGHAQFDLEGYAASRLAGAGVARIDLLGVDTYGDPYAWYSYRRATHRAEPDYGRQLSAVALAN